MRLTCEGTAPGGTTIWTSPDFISSVVPVFVTTPPSSTLILAVALFPSTAAVIVAGPGATPTTIPELDTVAFVASEVLQEKLRWSCSPAALLATAESWMLAAGTRVAVSDAKVTDATVGGGGGPTTLSPPPQEPMTHVRVSNPMKRRSLFMYVGM